MTPAGPVQPHTTDVDRKYALTKIKSGDYILPSNDGRTLWRIFSYVEDGSAEVSADGKNWRRLTGTHWQTSRYTRPFTAADDLPHDFLEWEHWEPHSWALNSRSEAIKDALRA